MTLYSCWATYTLQHDTHTHTIHAHAHSTQFTALDKAETRVS
jgi:hypothetical protein